MEDGGYAFPVSDFDKGGNTRTSSNKGMTLRDHFAGLAMQALISTGKYQAFTAELGEAAYKAADNMLKARM